MPLISTGFGFHSTAAEVVAGMDLNAKRVIVTGGSSGIGLETARALAGAGAEVTIAVRDVQAGDRAAADIAASTGASALFVEPLDLADRASIATFVGRWVGPLNVLINNAGVMALPELYTPEGWEMQFAINHLGHFALAHGLHSALEGVGGARIVSVSSAAHQRSPVIFDDLHFAFRRYDPMLAYGQSKTANILFAVAATRRWKADGITSNALMPGAILTRLQRHLAREEVRQMRGGLDPDDAAIPAGWKTVEQGAATSVLLAVSPLLEGIGGRYFQDCNEAGVVARRTPGSPGVAPYAIDPDHAERLWETSLELLA